MKKTCYKKRFLIGLLLACSYIIQAQTKKNTAIPIKMISGLPHYEIMINNKGPYLFGFDSGFGAEMELDENLANELGIKKTGETSVGDGSANSLVTLNIGTINNIQIGNYTKKNVTTILRNSERKNRPGMENVKGIIGIGMFTDNSITINYPKLEFTVENGNLPKADNKNIFEYEEVGGGIPKIKIQVGTKTIDALLDSRSMSGTFKIPENLVKKLTFLNTPKLVGKGKTISSTIDINEVQIKEAIQIGEFVFNEPTITYPSLNDDVIIGAKLLQKFSITIDTKNKRLQLIKGIEIEANKELVEYTGQYGDRKISVDGNNLFIQRPNGVLLKMINKNKDEFTLEIVPNALLLFERDANNKIIAIKVSKGNGDWETALKN